MKCPNCNNDYQCPCVTCTKQNPDKLPWNFVSDEEQSCPKCGLTKNSNAWMDIEWEQMKEKEKEIGQLNNSKLD